MTNRTFRPNWPVLALLLLVSMPFAATAFTIDSSNVAGSTFDVSWKLANGAVDPLGSVNNTGLDLSGTATFEILSKSKTEVSFELTLANTTAAAPAGDYLGLHAFGFGSGQFVQAASWSNGGSRGSNRIASVGAGGGAGLGSAAVGGRPIQVVASTDDGSAAPPAGQSIAPGEPETLEFRLKVPDTIDLISQPIALNPFEPQFGPDNPGGAGNPGGPGGNPLIAANVIPAPGTLALAVLGLVFGRRWFSRQA